MVGTLRGNETDVCTISAGACCGKLGISTLVTAAGPGNRHCGRVRKSKHCPLPEFACVHSHNEGLVDPHFVGIRLRPDDLAAIFGQKVADNALAPVQPA